MLERPAMVWRDRTEMITTPCYLIDSNVMKAMQTTLGMILSFYLQTIAISFNLSEP